MTTKGPRQHEPTEVTSIIRHRVKADQVAKYEDWLKKIVPIAGSFPGHSGVNVIRPPAGSTEYTVVLHFHSIEALTYWLESKQRKDLVVEALPMFEDGDKVEIKTGLEFWFTPAVTLAPRAPPHKQMLATLSVIYPLSILVPLFLRWIFDEIHLPHEQFSFQLVVVAIIVALMSYVIMPRYTKAIAKWLYRQ